MQSEELEQYLTRTGHVGLYDDSQFSCFCDKPLVNTVSTAPSPTASTTTVKPPLTTVKTKAITSTPVSPLSLDLGDTDIVNGNIVTVDRTKPPVQASHTLADVYTPTKVLTPAEIDQVMRTATAAQAKQDAGQVNAFLDRNKTSTTAEIPGQTKTFGGGWLWLILLAGAGLVVTSGKKTKTVEL